MDRIKNVRKIFESINSPHKLELQDQTTGIEKLHSYHIEQAVKLLEDDVDKFLKMFENYHENKDNTEDLLNDVILDTISEDIRAHIPYFYYNYKIDNYEEYNKIDILGPTKIREIIIYKAMKYGLKYFGTCGDSNPVNVVFLRFCL